MRAVMHITATLRGTIEARFEYDTDESVGALVDRAEAALSEELADKTSRYLHDIKFSSVKA